MDNDQKAVGAGGSQILSAGTTPTWNSLTNSELGQIYEMVILTAGSITTMQDKDGTNIKPILDGYESNADVTKVPITFPEGRYLANITVGTAVVQVYHFPNKDQVLESEL